MTGIQASDVRAEERTTDTEIVDYLQRNPEFFERHAQLLAELRIPHQRGSAVSLIERQVEALRTEVHRYKARIQTLVRLARDNETLNQRLHHMTLALIDAADFTEVVNILEDHLHEQFKADAVELRLFSATRLREHDGAQAPEPELEAFTDFFDRDRPVCGKLTDTQLDLLFGAEAEDVESAALLPVQGTDIMGILAIGSSDSGRFQPEMGTEFLVRLAEIVSRKLQVVSLPGV